MGKKNNNDKFYTKEEIVKKLVSLVDFSIYDAIIEPSAGDGSFIKNIKQYLTDTQTLIALDIEPEHQDIIKQDWFQYTISNEFREVMIIGNPPFGINNDLSLKFIKHAINFENVSTIAFILPNVFNKHTKQVVFPREWKLKQTIELPRDSFILENTSYHVPCSFYIWTKNEVEKDLRFNTELYQEHGDFKFVSKNDLNDVPHFFVMGSDPKKVKDLNEVKSTNRGYYIHVKNDNNIQKVKNIFLNGNWQNKGNSSASGGIAWFSKPEIVYIYTHYFSK